MLHAAGTSVIVAGGAGSNEQKPIVPVIADADVGFGGAPQVVSVNVRCAGAVIVCASSSPNYISLYCRHALLESTTGQASRRCTSKTKCEHQRAGPSSSSALLSHSSVSLFPEHPNAAATWIPNNSSPKPTSSHGSRPPATLKTHCPVRPRTGSCSSRAPTRSPDSVSRKRSTVSKLHAMRVPRWVS